MKEVFVTYGLGNFSLEKFKAPINNPGWNYKPMKGLFACRENQKYQWKDWVKEEFFYPGGAEDMYNDNLNNYEKYIENCFKFTISSLSKIFRLKYFTDYQKLVDLFPREDELDRVDWIKFYQKYDMLDVTGVLEAKHYFYPDNDLEWAFKTFMDSCDVDQIMIGNPKIVQIIT